MIVKKEQIQPFIKLIGIVFALAILVTADVIGQSIDYMEKAKKIEQISYFVNWPQNSEAEINNHFIITVIGKNPFNDNLEKIYSNLQIKSKQVKIKYITKIEELEKTDILFISGSETINLNKILSAIKNKPVLTISDTEGFSESGVIINFYETNSKYPFEVNLPALKKAGFNMNAVVLENVKITDNSNK